MCGPTRIFSGFLNIIFGSLYSSQSASIKLNLLGAFILHAILALAAYVTAYYEKEMEPTM